MIGRTLTAGVTLLAVGYGSAGDQRTPPSAGASPPPNCTAEVHDVAVRPSASSPLITQRTVDLRRSGAKPGRPACISVVPQLAGRALESGDVADEAA